MVLCSFSSTTEVEDHKTAKDFYIFAVGQGNSQLAVYGDFAVLYDCGSSSQKTHPKFEHLQNPQTQQLILSKISNATEPTKELATEELDDLDPDLTEQTNRDSERSNKSDGSYNSHVSNALSETRDIRTSIKNTIEKLGLKHLFIFVSHPDSDHYNLIQNTEKTILPINLPVTIFLCGDWLNTEDLLEKILFLRNLSKRKKT